MNITHYATIAAAMGTFVAVSACGDEQLLPDVGSLADDEAEQDVIAAEDAEPIEIAESPLTSCGWGSGEFVRVGDFNVDGKLDVVSLNGGTAYTYIATGTSFSFSSRSVANAWGGAGYTWAADFTGEDRTDIASASGGNVYMKLSNGKADIVTFSGCTVILHVSTGSGFVTHTS